MAIIFPANCRGVTSGAIREANRLGITTACGGLAPAKYLPNIVAHLGTHYFDKTEPCGVYMSALQNKEHEINEVTEAIQKSSFAMVEMAKESNKKLADVTGKMRDGSEKLGAAIDKFMAVAGRGDLAETVRLTESLVSSLERLAELEQKGLLDKVMKAMAKA